MPRLLTLCILALAVASIPAQSSAQRRVTFQESSVTVQQLVCPPKEKDLKECRDQATLRGDIAKAIRSDDYPQRAGNEQRGGTVRFRLLADPKDASRPGNCLIVMSSGHEDLDAETCKWLKRRVRFEAQSVNAMRTGVDGRVTWVPPWWGTAYDPREPIIHTGFLFGDVSDKPVCWTNKVRREETGFRVYLDRQHPNFVPGPSPTPDFRPEELSDGKRGSSFFLAPGESVMMSTNPHDACTMKIVQKDGRPAVEQHATFSWH